MNLHPDAADRIAQLEAEKAALLRDLKHADRFDCEHCASYEGAGGERCQASDYNCARCPAPCPCKDCADAAHWTWRGIQP